MFALKSLVSFHYNTVKLKCKILFKWVYLVLQHTCMRRYINQYTIHNAGTRVTRGPHVDSITDIQTLCYTYIDTVLQKHVYRHSVTDIYTLCYNVLLIYTGRHCYRCIVTVRVTDIQTLCYRCIQTLYRPAVSLRPVRLPWPDSSSGATLWAEWYHPSVGVEQGWSPPSKSSKELLAPSDHLPK